MPDRPDESAQAKKPLSNPFYRKWRKFKDAEHEMRFLKERAPAKMEEVGRSVPGFAELEAAYGFHVFNDVETTVQASFGHRLMFRKTLKGETASENGPSLVYSQGPTGDIVVVLYPPSSQLGRVNEKLIFLRRQERSAAKLMDGLQQDLKDLVAYAHVGSIDGDPSWGQRGRIVWLRFTRPSQRDKDFSDVTTHRPVTDLAMLLPKAVATSTLSALVKMILPVVVIALLGYFGFTGLIAMLNH